MDKGIIILGLKKSCIVLHGLAFSFKDLKIRNETLGLVIAIEAAIKELEK